MFAKKFTATLTSFVLTLTMILCVMPQSVHAVANESDQDVEEFVWFERPTGDICMKFWWYGPERLNKSNSHWNTYHASGIDSPSHPYPHLRYTTFHLLRVNIIIVDHC